MKMMIRLLALLFAIATHAAERPNIILILADDLGWKDVGWQGTDFYETPNLDRLAREGMIFTNAYAAGGNCAPSRACLLSGTYTPRHEVYAVQSTDRGPDKPKRLVPVPNKSGLANGDLTVAEALKAAGYATGIFGKWHLGGKDGAPPQQQGFDVTADTYAGGEAGGASGKKQKPKRDPGTDPKGIHSLTDAAAEFIAKHRDGPFFCYLSHHAIHTPLEASPEVLARFRAKNPGVQHSAAAYAACLWELDAGVGRLMARVKELGIEERTLVIFTSDNGGTQQSSQEPLRGNKGCYYEGGIREPFFARWPGTVKAGTTCDVPVINVDLFPTFLDAAGAPAPQGKLLDGESLLPLLRGAASLKREAIFWHFPGYLDTPVIRGRDPVFRTRPVSVIRKGGWKLHLYHEEWLLDGGRDALATNRAVELYNIAEDIGEKNDLAATNTARRDELLGDLLAWFKHTDAKLPARKNPAAEPGSK